MTGETLAEDKMQAYGIEERGGSDQHSIEDKADLSLTATTEGNLVYTNETEEPEVHLRTYLAVASMLLLNYVQVFALQGPPLVLSDIGASLDNPARQTWVPNSLSLVQAVVTPILSAASDTFQARKPILVVTCLISFIGAAIAPGSQNIYRLIGAQVMIGFGFSSVSLAYSVPSEVLPRKWRPLVQSSINVAAALAGISAPLIIGALSRHNVNGWRKFNWIQMGIWGLAAFGLFFGYRPPKRHTRYDHLSVFQKIKTLDLPGAALFATGLTLFLTGLNLGGGLYSWQNSRTLSTLVIGIVFIIGFGIYEWKGTKTGIAHHDLFRGGRKHGAAFGVFVALMFIEGITLFAYVIWYPVLTTAEYTSDTVILAARTEPFWIATALTTVLYGYWSVKARSIRTPLFVGFLLLTASMAALATLQPGDSTRACIFAGLAGIGFGAPLILIIAGIQLAIPHHLIATGTALAITSRAVAATVFTAIFSATFTEKLPNNIKKLVPSAAIAQGLPPSSVEAFVGALAGGDTAALTKIPGVTPAVIGAGVAALKKAFADSVRVIYIIAAPFGALACLLCFALGDQSESMTYRVDAPVEELHEKRRRTQASR